MKFLGVNKHDHVSHIMSRKRLKSLLSSGVIIRIQSVVRNLLNTFQGEQDKLHVTQM